MDIQPKPSPVLSSPSAAPQEQNESLRHLASAMKKLLPEPLFAEVMGYLDPLGTFVKALAAPSGEAQKEREKMIMLAVEGIEEWTRTIRQELLADDLLAASQGVSASAVAEIEQEMREWEWKRPGYTDNDLAKMKEWADRLAALRGDTK